MKKILAFVLAIAVISVFAVVPAFAADTMTFKLGEKEINVNDDGSAIALDFSIIDLTSSMDETAYGSVQFALELPDGVTFVSAAKASDNTYAWTNQTTNASFIGFTDDSGVGANIMANPEYGKFVVTLAVADTSKAAEYVIGIKADPAPTALDYIDYSDAVTSSVNGKIIVKAAAPAVKTVAKANPVINYNATTMTNGKTTDAQIGAALALKFTKPAATLQNKMIWAVQTNDGRKYSLPVDVQIADVTGDVAVAATFLNGIHENSFGIAEVAPIEITGVDGIFFDGTDYYYTNAADKDNKSAE